MARWEELTDELWAIIEPLIPHRPQGPEGKGRPWRENREMLGGILWVLKQRRMMIRPCFGPARHRNDRPSPETDPRRQTPEAVSPTPENRTALCPAAKLPPSCGTRHGRELSRFRALGWYPDLTQGYL